MWFGSTQQPVVDVPGKRARPCGMPQHAYARGTNPWYGDPKLIPAVPRRPRVVTSRRSQQAR